jgi:hypothetical protein
MKRLRNRGDLALLFPLFFPALAVAATDTFTIPAGTELDVKLTSTLSTRTGQNGDPFTAEVDEPIFWHGVEVVPAGSTLTGHISFVKEPGRAKGHAEMRLTPEMIVTPDGTKYAISAALQKAEDVNGSKMQGEEGTIVGAGKSRRDTAIESGIGAGVGAGVGAIADGGSGALYGAAIGATAALIHRLTRRHPDLVLPPGTELTFVISRPAAAVKVISPAAPLASAPDHL